MVDTELTPTRTGARWHYPSDKGSVSFDFARVDTSSRSGMYAWVEIHKPNMATPTHFGTYNLMGSRTVSELQKVANGMPEGFINDAVYDMVQRQQAGESPVDLSTLKGDDPPWWLLPPLVAAGGATHLIAAGGSFKSYLALAASFSIATGSSHYLGMKPSITGPVLYLDWEATKETFLARSRALTQRKPPEGVFYRAEKFPIRRSVDSLAKLCDELGIVLMVVDSMMLARGGDAFGPDETIMLFSAIREIGRPAIIVDHKSQEAIRKGRRGAYGSIVGANSIRLTWEITAAVEVEPDVHQLRLEQGKSNDIPRQQPLGFQLAFDNEANQLRTAVITSIDPSVMLLGKAPEGDEIASQLDRRLREVNNEPQLVKELADATGIKEQTVRTILKRHTRRFETVGEGRSKRWRLKELGGPDQRHLYVVPDDETAPLAPYEDDNPDPF